MLSESIKALLAHVSETHIKNLRDGDQASTIEGLLKSEDDSLINVRLDFDDGSFLYKIAIRSKQAKPNSSLSIQKKGDDDRTSEVGESQSKSEFEKLCLQILSEVFYKTRIL